MPLQIQTPTALRTTPTIAPAYEQQLPLYPQTSLRQYRSNKYLIPLLAATLWWKRKHK